VVVGTLGNELRVVAYYSGLSRGVYDQSCHETIHMIINFEIFYLNSSSIYFIFDR